MKLSRHHRHQLISILSLLMLLQGLFPMQLHTLLVRDAQGQLIEICTIDGIRHEKIDFGQQLPDSDHSPDHNRSAAMAFSDLMAEASPIAFQLDPGKAEAPEQPALFSSSIFFSRSPIGLSAIRAPPVI